MKNCARQLVGLLYIWQAFRLSVLISIWSQINFINFVDIYSLPCCLVVHQSISSFPVEVGPVTVNSVLLFPVNYTLLFTGNITLLYKVSINLLYSGNITLLYTVSINLLYSENITLLFPSKHHFAVHRKHHSTVHSKMLFTGHHFTLHSTLTRGCIKVHSGVPIVLCLFDDPL